MRRGRQSRPNWAEVNEEQGKGSPGSLWNVGKRTGQRSHWASLGEIPNGRNRVFEPEGRALSPGAAIICRISPLTPDPALDLTLSLRMRRASTGLPWGPSLPWGPALVLTCQRVSLLFSLHWLSI